MDGPAGPGCLSEDSPAGEVGCGLKRRRVSMETVSVNSALWLCTEVVMATAADFLTLKLGQLSLQLPKH